jgi:hypothetical protein
MGFVQKLRDEVELVRRITAFLDKMEDMELAKKQRAQQQQQQQQVKQ